jgi:ribosomal protein S18 acetylase RimI-like enzyme
VIIQRRTSKEGLTEVRQGKKRGSIDSRNEKGMTLKECRKSGKSIDMIGSPRKHKRSTRVRPLISGDRKELLSILNRAGVFPPQEVEVAMELIDTVLEERDQKDYRIHCLVDDQNQPLGFICYGPAPMAEGTYDLYWIVVDPGCQKKGEGSKLLGFLEAEVRRMAGRMILADTSSTTLYEGAHKFYSGKGFREVARIPDYYAHGNDRITFCKTFQ